jgi:hypothetical protein
MGGPPIVWPMSEASQAQHGDRSPEAQLKPANDVNGT